MTRRTGIRATSQENNGLHSSVTARVPRKSFGNWPTPEAAATASRIGRIAK